MSYKHAAVVKAWLDGKQIERRFKGNPTWELVRHNPDTARWVPSFDEQDDYRIYVKPVKTEAYRRYVFKRSLATGETVYRVGSVTTTRQVELTPGWPSFVKWIDTEWQTHDVTNEVNAKENAK